MRGILPKIVISARSCVAGNMMVPDQAKILLTIGVSMLIGCPNVQSASISDLLKAILDTLRNVENLLKYNPAISPLPFDIYNRDPAHTKILLKRMRDQYLNLAQRRQPDNMLHGSRSIKRPEAVAEDDDDDMKPAESIDIVLPSRRQLHAMAKQNKQSNLQPQDNQGETKMEIDEATESPQKRPSVNSDPSKEEDRVVEKPRNPKPKKDLVENEENSAEAEDSSNYNRNVNENTGTGYSGRRMISKEYEGTNYNEEP